MKANKKEETRGRRNAKGVLAMEGYIVKDRLNNIIKYCWDQVRQRRQPYILKGTEVKSAGLEVMDL